MRRRPALLAVALAALASTTAVGCGTSLAPRAAPNCEDAGRPGSPATILMAQSVPTATLIPCTVLLPVGWKVGTVHARSGSARFALSSDRAGSGAVEVRLQRHCDVRGTTQVPTDEAGTQRFERVLATDPVLRMVRYYTFSGGCATYSFNLHGTQRAVPSNEASLAVGFIRRADVAERVRADSHGRLTLDPPGRER